MSTAPLSISAVVVFIQENADENDLDSIIEAVRTCRRLLQEQATAAVKPGLAVTIRGPYPRNSSTACAARSKASNGSAASAPPW
jgi:hypothetical protein